MTNETLLYKNISLVLFSKRAHCLLLVWEIDGETYLRERTSSSHIFFQEPGVSMLAPPCKLVRDAFDQLCVPRSTVILCTLSKSDCVVLIMWSPSGYIPVRPECPDAPSSSRLLIKMWQLTKAHGVTRNEPKIHVIRYVTFLSMPFFKMSTYRHFLPISLHLPSTPYTKQNKKITWTTAKIIQS